MIIKMCVYVHLL